jgi:hypothetical protein
MVLDAHPVGDFFLSLGWGLSLGCGQIRNIEQLHNQVALHHWTLIQRYYGPIRSSAYHPLATPLQR